MRFACLFVLAPLVALTACAAPEQPSAAEAAGRDCFSVRQVNGFQALDEGGVRLSVGAGDAYDADLMGPGCEQLRWSESLALESRPSSFICVGDGPGLGEIMFRDSGIGLTTCQITAVRRAPEEAAPSEAPPGP